MSTAPSPPGARSHAELLDALARMQEPELEALCLRARSSGRGYQSPTPPSR